MQRTFKSAKKRPVRARKTSYFPTEQLEPRCLLTATIHTTTDARFVVFSGVGATDATAARNAFIAAIGGAVNGNAAAEQPNGSRDINWDGVLLDGTDFNGLTQTIVPNKVVGIPINRFQARGVLFGDVYAVAGDGFASVNPSAAGLINAFTPDNTFAHFNAVDLDEKFITPSDPATTPVQQATRGFGAMFLNVEENNSSSIQFLNGTDSLGTFFVPKGSAGGEEFLGVLYNSPIVTDVVVAPGNTPLFKFKKGVVSAGAADLSTGHGENNLAAVDNLDYAEPAAPITPTIIHETEGTKFSAGLGNFRSSLSGATASKFSATINWGDGTTSKAGIGPHGTRFDFSGQHAYASAGTFNITIAIRDTSGDKATAAAVADVADAPLIATGRTFAPSASKTFSGTVATFVDDDASQTDVATYTGSINWGDGSTSAATFTEISPGNFDVNGKHRYASKGNFIVRATIDDIGGSTTSSRGTAKVT